MDYQHALSCHDSCDSWPFDTTAGAEGSGFPVIKGQPLPHSVSGDKVERLRVVQPDFKRLPADFYKFAVEHLPIMCESWLY